MICKKNPTQQSSLGLEEVQKAQREPTPLGEMECLAADHERWAVIPNYQRLLASSTGRIKTIAGRILIQRAMPSGYLTVCIKSNDEARWFPRLVHRLVGLTFLGKSPKDKTQIRHLNGKRQDNRIENLAWGDNRENQADRKMHGTHLEGERAPGAKLTNQQASEIRIRALNGENQRVLAKMFNVSASLVTLIKKNKIYLHCVEMKNAPSPVDCLCSH